MPKKMTEAEFLKRVSKLHPEYDFSNFTYSGYSDKSTVICPTHGAFMASPSSLLHNIKCRQCYDERRGQSLVMSFAKFLKKARAIHGDAYEYSEKDWCRATELIPIYCKTHQEYFQQLPTNHIGSQKQGCPKCGQERTKTSRLLTQSEFIANCVDQHGDRYDLSKIEYKGSKYKIEVVCKKHGSFFPSAGNFVKGSGCPKCKHEATSERSRHSFESYLQRFTETHGDTYEYIEVFYTHAAYVRAVCKVHGEFTQLASDHIRGFGCSKCTMNIYDQASFIEESRKIHGDKYDYSMVEYRTSHDKVSIICPTHGVFEQVPYCHVTAGQGCRKCSKIGPSKGQREIAEFINSLGLQCETDHRFHGRKEIDILVPDRKLGIEFNGLIWHSTKFSRNPYHIKEKSIMAAERGARLIHIYQDEWEQKRPVVEKTLRSLLGVDKKLAARKTRCVHVDPATANAFLDNNHLQGGISGSAEYLGLYDGDVLVGVMAFSRVVSHRGAYKDDACVELRRYASSLSIVGGASKLFSAYIKLHPEVSEVLSYSDNRVFNGTMYRQLGFIKTGEAAPDYCYVSPRSKIRHNKARFQRKNLPEIFGDKFDPSRSEVDNCLRNGWYRLFDSGKTRWFWSR